MERFRLEVGRDHGAVPGKIVGAICNEGGLDSQYFGRISIHDEFTLVDLPEGMPKAIFKDLKRTRVCGKPLRISRVNLRDGGNPMGEPDVQQRKEKSSTTRTKPKKNKLRSGGDKPPKRRKHSSESVATEASGRSGKKPKAKSGSKPKSGGKPKRIKNKGKPKSRKSRSAGVV